MRKKGFSLFLSLIMILTMLFSIVGCNKSENKEKQNQNNKNSTMNEKEEKDSTKFQEAEITALLPPWYEFSQEMLDDFKEETGIKVNLQIMDWDPLVEKVFTSCAAGTAPADVTEFSWDWVGNFGAAGWYEPLNKYFGDDFFEDITTKDVFKYKNDYLAVPIYNDFRLTYVNKKYFEDAGISEMPKTPEELLESALKIKEKGVSEYPLTVPFSATAGTTTPWFLMTKAYGGELFDDNWKPLFEDKESAGYRAMELLIKGLKEYKVIDPASVGLKGTDIVEGFKEGKGAIDLAGWAGNVSSYTNPDESKIAEAVEIIQVPGLNGNSRTYGLHEAIGIPSASENKEAAAEFIKWLNKPEIVKKLFIDMGIFPNHQSTIEELVKEGKLPGGETVLKVMPTIEPLFPQGAPKWYSEFETEVATAMNQMAKGSITLEEGIKSIADISRKLVEENK